MGKLIYHGHATFTVETNDGTRLMIDPFLDESPVADIRVGDIDRMDYILLTHGHFDHVADAVPLARKTDATIISTYEIVSWAQQRGIEKGHPLHIGGGYPFPFGYVKMTAALHGGQVHGDDGKWTTVPGGFLLNLPETRLYHAGDTALLTDMQLLKGRVDVALLPIGDNFTMGPDDAVRAVEFIEPSTVVPMHYDTFEVIQQDPEAFKAAVGDRATVEIMKPGDSLAI